MQIKNSAVSMIIDAADEKELEEIKLQFLGRSGRLTLALKEITKVPREKRAAVGMLANDVKKTIEETIENKISNFKFQTSNQRKEEIDITIPGKKPPAGHLHLITQAVEEISEIFRHIIFSKLNYPLF